VPERVTALPVAPRLTL
jgi:hypothetical protein